MLYLLILNLVGSSPWISFNVPTCTTPVCWCILKKSSLFGRNCTEIGWTCLDPNKISLGSTFQIDTTDGCKAKKDKF